MDNLFNTSSYVLSKNEVINKIIDTKSVRIEQIISTGQSSQQGFWYDQDEAEWVLLLKGSAILEYKDNSTVTLNTGDSLLIPPHILHRVKYTENPTIWLAVFYTE